MYYYGIVKGKGVGGEEREGGDGLRKSQEGNQKHPFFLLFFFLSLYHSPPIPKSLARDTP